MKITENANKKHVAKIRKKLAENKEKYGQAYCPCINPNFYNTDDNVCMCKDFLENVGAGEYCHCMLYRKDEE